jgi:Phage capsid family
MRNSSPPNTHFCNPLRRTHGGLEIDGGLETAAHSHVDDSLIVRQSAEHSRRTRRIGALVLIRQTASPYKGAERRTSPASTAVGRSRTGSIQSFRSVLCQLDERDESHTDCQPLTVSATGVAYPALFGRPVIPAEHSSTIGTVGDIILGDFSRYVLATKAPKGDLSIHVNFLNDENLFRFVMRVDGQTIDAAPVTPLNGTNTTSPFVVLASRP